MGWLFSPRWGNKEELRRHLTDDNGLKTLKSCWTGNNLWAVQEVDTKDGKRIRFIALYLCRNGGKYEGWGYKDMDETAGPYYYNCPLSYLDMVPDPMTTHSTPWRVLVREYWAKRRMRFDVGTRIKLYGREYKVGERRNGDVMIWDYDVPYRLPKRMYKDVEVLV